MVLPTDFMLLAQVPISIPEHSESCWNTHHTRSLRLVFFAQNQEGNQWSHKNWENWGTSFVPCSLWNHWAEERLAMQFSWIIYHWGGESLPIVAHLTITSILGYTLSKVYKSFDYGCRKGQPQLRFYSKYYSPRLLFTTDRALWSEQQSEWPINFYQAASTILKTSKMARSITKASPTYFQVKHP